MIIPFPKQQYRTIYIDPPWPERGGGKIKRGADRHYPLMSLKEIQALPVSDLAHPDGCHLYLWTTNNYLPAALSCIKTWGFEYITTITWLKDRVGLGQYYRGITEHCIFCLHQTTPTLSNQRGQTLPRQNRVLRTQTRT